MLKYENLCSMHRIIDDRIEKSKKGRRIRHNLRQRVLPQVYLRCKDCVSIKYNRRIVQEWSQEGGGPGRYCPGAPSSLTQSVPNSSSLYTLFYSVIYNSMTFTFHTDIGIIRNSFYSILKCQNVYFILITYLSFNPQ